MKTLREDEPALICPAPLPVGDRVVLGHGSGGRLSADLLAQVILPAFDNPALARLDDQAVVTVNGTRLAFTTDSFVVQPLFFPGGDIGSLAVYGTVNDLAMGGARPLWLSMAFILEEGLPLESFQRIVASAQRAAAACGVPIVTGDTKVVEKGKGDGLFVNTSGVGLVAEGVELSAGLARPGDRILLSGPIGEHGIAILAQRAGLEFETPLESDSTPLHSLVADMLATGGHIRCMRDPTRGGVSSALNEIAGCAGVGMVLEEDAIPMKEEVRAACELLGFDPLYVANEGKLLAIVSPGDAEEVRAAMRSHPRGRDACVIGVVTADHPGMVTMRTSLGTSRIVDMLSGDQLPRIC
jgi:hydrogenase expression/formation protein HypE